jgi:PST family polysaccharide transporter
MNIRKAFILTSIHTAIKILSGIVMTKIIAVYLGPAGMAIIGQFQNFTQIIVNLASGSIHTGIVKYTAEHEHNPELLHKYWNNGLLISFILSSICLIAVLLFADSIASNILFSVEYHDVIIVFALSLVFYVLNLFMLAMINGLQNVKLYSYINIAISVITLIITSVLTIRFALYGALYAFIISQSIVFFITLYHVNKYYQNIGFSVKEIFKSFDFKIGKKLLAFGVASFVSGVGMAIMLIVVRFIIEARLSIEFAGYWEALWKISTYFMMLSLLPASVYYLPKYSSAESLEQIKNSLYEAFRFFLPFQIVAIVFILFFRIEIIKLLFTDEFLIIAPLMMFMFIGDVLRVSGQFISNVFYGRAIIKYTVISEVLYNFLLISLVYFFVDLYGFNGLAYAYVLANSMIFVYFFYYYLHMKNILFKRGDTFVEKETCK